MRPACAPDCTLQWPLRARACSPLVRIGAGFHFEAAQGIQHDFRHLRRRRIVQVMQPEFASPGNSRLSEFGDKWVT